MFRKIACPFDFSSAAINAVEYAANLARLNSARLTLVNIQKVYAGESTSILAGGELPFKTEAEENAQKLEEYVREIHNVFNIECNFDIHASMSHFSNSLKRLSFDYDLIVIGTNGESDLAQFYTGSDSYEVAKKSAIPVLIVPENYSHKTIKKILFASDYTKDDSLQMEQLLKFTKPVAAELEVIHISRKDTLLSSELYRTFVSYTQDILSSIANVHFKRIVSDDPIETIEDYIGQSGADLLALKYKKHSLLYKFLHQNLIKELAADQQLPILIFHN